MPTIPNAPSGEDTVADGTEKIPVSGSKYMLVSTIAEYIRTLTQTLTNKTLTTPTIADFTNAQHDHGDADDGGLLTNVALLTGDQTIAGVKTFSSDPIVPAESYGSGWNGSNEPPTKNDVYDKIETMSGGLSFWNLALGTPVRASNTTFTVTGDYTSLFRKCLVIKWTESSTTRFGMVAIPSTYSAPNTTVTIIGNTMASIDASSLKYALAGVEAFAVKFTVSGTIGAILTDVSITYATKEPMIVLGADIDVETAGTTNNTTIDLNKNGTTMFTTKPTLATTVGNSPLPFTADTATTLALNDKVTMDVDAVQTTAAIGLTGTLYVFPARLEFLT